MCGIAGELRFEHGPSTADWESLSQRMRRRGPDDDGLWSDDVSCTLAFRRLAILDLSPRGHQPMIDETGRYVLVFNGEIYNFRDLRRQLQLAGHTFRSTGDGEVVLKALMHWGTHALGRFNGIFAIALFDRSERRMLLARDHAGIKPLYVMRDRRGVVFASQYDQLLAHPWCDRRPVDERALGLYLRYGYIPAPYGLMDQTGMIEPGSWLEVSADKATRAGRYWQFAASGTPELCGQEAVEAVDEVVARAVKRQLVSDVPVGAFLSGGIDSPLVIASMLEAGHPNLRAYTIGAAGHDSDESADAERYARELGVEQVVEHITPEAALALLPEVVAASSEPFGDYSIFPTMLVSRLASRDFKVMLSGDGGDELFWGYPQRSAELIRFSSVFRIPYALRWLKSRLPRYRGEGVAASLKTPTVGAWYERRHTRLRGNWLTHVFPDLPDPPSDFDGFDYRGHAETETAEWLRWNEFSYHLTMVLLKVDRASMHYSQEVRVPLLDRDVIEVASQIDWRSCLDLTTSIGKLPLRHALARHVKFQTRTKKGFEAPMADWLRGPLRDRFEQLVIEPAGLLGQAIDQTAIRSLFDEHISGQRDHARGLWPLLSLAMWRDHHLQPPAV